MSLVQFALFSFLTPIWCAQKALLSYSDCAKKRKKKKKIKSFIYSYFMDIVTCSLYYDSLSEARLKQTAVHGLALSMAVCGT